MACVDGVCLIYPALILSALPSPLRWVGLVASILSHVLVGKKPYDQGGPDVGDRFCQKANQKLSEFLDMFRQMCVVKSIQKCLGSETVRGGWKYQLVS